MSLGSIHPKFLNPHKSCFKKHIENTYRSTKIGIIFIAQGAETTKHHTMFFSHFATTREFKLHSLNFKSTRHTTAPWQKFLDQLSNIGINEETQLVGTFFSVIKSSKQGSTIWITLRSTNYTTKMCWGSSLHRKRFVTPSSVDLPQFVPARHGNAQTSNFLGCTPPKINSKNPWNMDACKKKRSFPFLFGAMAAYFSEWGD